jgi:hypothetical protein
MVFATAAFLITWAIGAVEFWLTLRATRSLRRLRRVAIQSFVFAVFFTPALFIGHAIAVCPALASLPMSLLAWPGIKPIDAVGTSAVFILLGWVLTALVGLAVTTTFGSSKAVPPDRVPERCRK